MIPPTTPMAPRTYENAIIAANGLVMIIRPKRMLMMPVTACSQVRLLAALYRLISPSTTPRMPMYRINVKGTTRDDPD
ncbi:MAG: hypothetical protein WB392_10935 [Methanotrichaceae archaeon]